jgi:Ras-related protein Rab-5C
MVRSVDAKVVLLGATSVGKTSIITRAVADFHDPSQEPTVGTSFSVKEIDSRMGRAKLWIWDTAGQERFRTLGSLYYHNAQAVIVVFSLCDRDSLVDAERWADEVRSHFQVVPLMFLLGNKADLVDKRAVKREDAMAAADKLGGLYIETSAVRGENIAELFDAVAERLLDQGMLITGHSTLENKQKTDCQC